MAAKGAYVTQSELFSLPQGWIWTRLEELIDHNRGICYGIVQPEKHDPQGIPMVNSQDILNGIVASHIDFRVSCELHKRYQRSTIKGGELLLTLVGANFGRVAIAPPNFAGFNCSRPVGIIPVTGCAKYVMFCLRSPFARRFMDNWANTTAQPTFNLKDVANLPIPLPPKSEQIAIAHILGTLDDKIELNRRMNETLEAMAKAIFQSWFVDFDPVRAKTEGRDTGLPKHIADLLPDSFEDSELGKIPKGWNILCLGDVLSVLETGGRPKGGVLGISEGVPSVGAESITRIGEFDYSKTKFVPNEFFNSMNRGHVEDGDVLLYKDGGRPGVFEPHLTMVGDGFPFKEFCINEHVYRLRSAHTISQYFLYFWLSSDAIMDEMRNRGTGVAIPGLNSTQVRNLPILSTEHAIQALFAKLVSPLIHRIFLNSKHSQSLAKLRNTLLPKLISGELRIKDVERFIERVTT